MIMGRCAARVQRVQRGKVASPYGAKGYGRLRRRVV